MISRVMGPNITTCDVRTLVEEHLVEKGGLSKEDSARLAGHTKKVSERHYWSQNRKGIKRYHSELELETPEDMTC